MKMKKKTGRVLIWLLAVAVVLGIGGAWLFRGDAVPEAEALSTTTKTLYVAKNEAAGLHGDVVLIANGNQYVLYLPGSADASKLCFSWKDSVTVKDSSGTVLTSGKAPIAAPGSTVEDQDGAGKSRCAGHVPECGHVDCRFLQLLHHEQFLR